MMEPSTQNTNTDSFGSIASEKVESELNTILAALDQTAIVATTDARGRILYVNNQFCEISGYSREELVGRDHSLINSGHHDPSFFTNLWQTIAQGKIWMGEIQNRSKSGKAYWVDTTIVPFLDKNARPYKYVAIRRDITDRKQAQEELREQQAMTIYSEKMASLGEMAAGIAHEIGNPLGALRGRLEMLEMQLKQGRSDPEDWMTFTSRGLGLIDRITKIIKGLQVFSRNASEDAPTEVSLNRLIAEILELSQSRLHRECVALRVKGLMQDVQVPCREAEIGQVLVNLINNSCDAIKGQDKPWVEVSLKNDTDFAQISVKDSGTGIEASVAEKMFTPFFSSKPKGQGTGLGLGIARNIVERHRGQLEYETSEDGHTCFTILLPKSH